MLASEALGLPLHLLSLPEPCPNTDDEAVLAPALATAADGVTAVAFGDLALADLPDGVDACGERGEFHTFVTDAPGFAAPIVVEAGAVTERDGYAVCRPALPR